MPELSISAKIHHKKPPLPLSFLSQDLQVKYFAVRTASSLMFSVRSNANHRDS